MLDEEGPLKCEIGAALLVMRTYALYDRSPRILAGLLSLVAVGGGVGLVSDHHHPHPHLRLHHHHDVFVVMMWELTILFEVGNHYDAS